MKILVAIAILLAPLTLGADPYEPSRLDRAIERYERISGDGGWPMIDDSSTLREGDASRAVDALIERLAVEGDLEAPRERFDSRVTQAVKNFQHRYGLDADGVVGPKTFAALNVEASERAAQLRTNRKRMEQRTLASDTYVAVNIPDFHLYYVEDGKTVLNLRVIVGDVAWDTPSMSDVIETIVFKPRWNIPIEIVAADLAPKVAANPNYLTEKNMTVVEGGYFSDEVVDPASIDWANVSERNFPYFVYQTAGPDNPLGQVKFLFPNSEDIYLHDTPDKYLFGLDNRAQSHGCIRVEEPFRLAESLIKDERLVEGARSKESSTQVALEPHIPVHLVYWTAWADDDGVVHFREDIYGRDT